MKSHQTTALVILALFYTAYFTKMILQAKKGVKTDQMAKGSKPRKLLIIERLLKMATFSIIPVEAVSIILDWRTWKSSPVWIGIAIAFLGVMIFVIAMVTMRDSWRAGIPEKDKTVLVTSGIYRFSRNPAFLGFDLMYLGILFSFFNYLHLLFALFAVVMLHLQILQEEKFLTAAFGESYTDYKKRTGRYLIIDKSYGKKNKMDPHFFHFSLCCLGIDRADNLWQFSDTETAAADLCRITCLHNEK